MNLLFIASICEICLFAVTIAISLYGLINLASVENKHFFKLFYMQILLISLLSMSIGLINIIMGDQSTYSFYISQILNIFSLIIQFALILTITYGWTKASMKLKDQYIALKQHLVKLKIFYTILSVCLLTLYGIVESVLLYSLIRYSKMDEFIINICELFIYIFLIVALGIQQHVGYKLSKLLNQFRSIISDIPVKKFRFYLIYIGAFLFIFLRSVIEIYRIIIYLVNKQDSFKLFLSNRLQYFIVYQISEIIPITFYLIGVQAQLNQAQVKVEDVRKSLTSDSERSSRRETELVKKSYVTGDEY